MHDDDSIERLDPAHRASLVRAGRACHLRHDNRRGRPGQDAIVARQSTRLAPFDVRHNRSMRGFDTGSIAERISPTGDGIEVLDLNVAAAP
jgi:hypothetical protein